MMCEKIALIDCLRSEIRSWRKFCIKMLKMLFLEVNGQVAFLSATEQVADEFRDRELRIMAELVEKLFIFVRDGSLNILVSRKFLLSSDSSHVFGFVLILSRFATIAVNIQSFSLLFIRV